MLKALFGHPVFQFLVGRAIGLYMLLVAVTTRWERVNQAAAEPFWRGGARVVMCAWHGRFMQLHRLWFFGANATKIRMLISRSREGGIVTHAARMVGGDVVRGSAAKRGQQKGGREAVREMVRLIDEGVAVSITPDGPRGPRMRASIGAVQIAKMAQAALLPVAWSTHGRKLFNSWDRFILPLPFGRGALVWGDPIPPPPPNARGAEMEQVRQRLEDELNRITTEADRLVGAVRVEPAPRDESVSVEPATT
jgi:lysophospholipid acyltransferase (LPLAT)-like uncharacterized protein